MHPVAPETILTQLGWRYATKKFDATRKIPPDVWGTLEETLRLAPSSYGLQPWKFVVVTDPAVRARLHAVSWKQPQILDASHLVVFAVKKGMGPADAQRLVDHTGTAVRGTPPAALDGYLQMMSGSLTTRAAEVDAWMARQVYMALGVFLSAAALLGVDACPMEGFQPQQYDDVLGLGAKGYGSVVLAAAGYRSPGDDHARAAKVRYPRHDVIEHV